MALFPVTHSIPRATSANGWWARPRASTTLAVILSAGVLLVLAFAGPLVLLGALIVGAVIVAVVARPKIGLYLAVLSVPVQDTVKASGLTVTQTAFVLLIGAWMVGLLLRVRGSRWDWLTDANLWRFALFYAVILASARVAGDVRLTLSDAFRWGEALVIFAIARDVLRTRRDWAALLACCCVGASGEAFIGSVQSKLGLGNASFAVAEGLSRAFGTFGRPNSYAGYLEMTFPLALAGTFWAVPRMTEAFRTWQATTRGPLMAERHAAWTLWGRILAASGLFITVAFLLTGIILSFSRGAWLGTVAAVLVMMMLAGRRMARATGVVIVVAVLVLALGGANALPDVLAKRLTSVTDNLIVTSIDDTPITDDNFAVKERTAYWFGGLQMFRDNPLTGVGLGNYGPNYDARYYSAPFLISQVHAHNYYIHIAAETGIFGLLAYLFLIGGIIRTGVAASRACTDSFARAVAIGATGVVVAVAVHNFFEDLHVLSLGVHLSAVWGVLAAIHARYPTARIRSHAHTHAQFTLDRQHALPR